MRGDRGSRSALIADVCAAVELPDLPVEDVERERLWVAEKLPQMLCSDPTHLDAKPLDL
jgi:hypothetical protein